jgi:trans-aconitate methyltransferase
MKRLPSPETYEKEELFMPWGTLTKEILNWILKEVSANQKIIDLMCGPGQLLGKIQSKRKDLQLTGLDTDKRYIKFASIKYPFINFINDDILKWKTKIKYNLVLVTGGIHHIPYNKKRIVIKSIYDLLDNNGVCIIADPFIDNYVNEKQRKIAAAKLGYEYIKAVITNNAPDEIVSAAIDILFNDVLPKGEYKTSITKFRNIIDPIFSKVELHKTWPNITSEYGDYYFILSK